LERLGLFSLESKNEDKGILVTHVQGYSGKTGNKLPSITIGE